MRSKNLSKTKTAKLKNTLALILTATMTLLLFASCSGVRQMHRSSNITDYLHNEQAKLETPRIPTLTPPLRVGIAFVPTPHQDNETLTEQIKSQLTETVAAHFEDRDYVQGIERIPSSYLKKNGSFNDLDKIRAIFDIDAIVLLSYDQSQFTDEGFASLSYWTLIGAYIIPGERNETHTMIDAVIYDIDSKSMLFHAAGSHQLKSNATPVNLSEQLRRDSQASFIAAGKTLIVDLEEQLQHFRAAIQQTQEQDATL